MSYPTAYHAQRAVPLPPDDHVRAVIGDGYDPDKTLNVLKMFSGTDEMFPAVSGFVKAVFAAKGISPKTRELNFLKVAGKNSMPSHPVPSA